MTPIPPLQEGLFASADGGPPRLLASRCATCDRVFFPQRTYCGQCGATGLQQLPLAARGTVHSFSLIGRKPAAAIVEPPYVQAEVAMPEGVHVFTVLDHCTFADVRAGLPVEMYVDELQAPNGGRALAYKFRPVAEGGAA